MPSKTPGVPPEVRRIPVGPPLPLHTPWCWRSLGRPAPPVSPFSISGTIVQVIYQPLVPPFVCPSTPVVWKYAHVDAMELLSRNRCYGVSIEEYASLCCKGAFIRTYKNMGIQKDGRSTETIICDQYVRKYVRVTTIMIFDQVYITDNNFITTDRIGVGYWHSHHSGQGQYVYHTYILCTYIYLIYQIYQTLTYRPTNFRQYPHKSDLQT